jgi:uncharacterized protein YvpB
MKKIANFVYLFSAAFFFVAFNEVNLDFFKDQELMQEIPVVIIDQTKVSSVQAVEIAEIFFGRQVSGGSALRKSSGRGISVETVKESDNPLFHVINYPEGGWIIVGATKNYYPVLAFSEENSFMMSPDNVGLATWIEETKEAVRISNAFDGETKNEIRAMWRTFEESEGQLDSASSPMLRSFNNPNQAFEARLDELFQQYAVGHDGDLYFYRLSDARNELGDDLWNYYTDVASNVGSPWQFTIVGIRTTYTPRQVGPLLQTSWHQRSPYNDLVSPAPAGCAAIAVAQIMKYYHFPNSFTLNGYSFNWNTVGIWPTSGSDHHRLVRLVGSFVNMTYWNAGSWALAGNVESGLRSMGYNVTRKSHDLSDVTNALNQQRPVLMLGGTNPLPAPLSYINGHYWVCDGRMSFNYSETCFVQFLRYDSNGYYYCHLDQNPPNFPRFITASSSVYYHMNWGGASTGWYAVNNLPGNFGHQRQNYYIQR